MTLDDLLELRKNSQVTQKNNKTENSPQAIKIVKKAEQNKEKQSIKKIEGDFPKKGVLKLKVKALSPIHIGTGSVYEPINFIIDEEKLYHFKDEDFLSSLTPALQRDFLDLVSTNTANSFVKIHHFVKNNKDYAKKIVIETIPVTKAVEEEYLEKVGKEVHKEVSGKKTTNVFNKFEIEKIQKKLLKSKTGKYLPFAYIPGSSLKGSISTAYQEFIYHKEGDRSRINKFADNKTITEHVFKNFKVADSKYIVKSSSRIAQVSNKKRLKEKKDSIVKIMEAIKEDSEFKIDITYNEIMNGREVFKIKDILNSCNEHYIPLFESQFNEESDKAIKEILEYNFLKSYENLRENLKENQFLLRVGKHSGARAVTIDELRKGNIKIMQGKGNSTKYKDEETTAWLFAKDAKSNKNFLPFGWLLCEIEDIEKL